MSMAGSTFAFAAPVALTFGVGAIKQLGDQVRDLGRRALLVTDPGLVRVGVVERVAGILTGAGLTVSVFAEVDENPRVQTVLQGAAQCKAEQCDLVIAVGGGSSMDAAKVIAALATDPERDPRTFEGVEKVVRQPLPLVMVPTTAGTASEVTPIAVITDTDRVFKFTIISRKLYALRAVLDPELTVGKPPALTAATGMDALTHAIESFTNRTENPISSALAVRAIELIGGSLRTAVVQGQNLQARSDMLLGSLLAGLAFAQTRLGLVHAMSHPISAHYGVPHGIANAVLLPPVLSFNLFGAIEQTAQIGRLLGEQTAGLAPLAAARQGVEAVQRLSDDVGIPRTLSGLGVKAEGIPVMAADAMLSGNILVNPRQVRLEDVVTLYRSLLPEEVEA